MSSGEIATIYSVHTTMFLLFRVLPRTLTFLPFQSPLALSIPRSMGEIMQLTVMPVTALKAETV